MVIIELETVIDAPQDRVFDLCRSIEFHEHTSSKSGEKAVAGRTAGLIDLDDTVTWRAKHLGVVQELTVRITEFDRPRVFADQMIKGAFSKMNHAHRFSSRDGQTVMSDRFEFGAPFGILGRAVEAIFLRRYMERFLIERGQLVKHAAESEEWRQYL